MDERVQRALIGTPEQLAFELAWGGTGVARELRPLGAGGLVLWFAGHRVWSAGPKKDQPVVWTWVDLVEHLGRAWSYLRFEENAPYGLVANGPEQLRNRRLLRSVPGVSATAVEDAIHRYQHRHDLAAGLKGISLPPVWLLPEGHLMRVRAEKRERLLPLSETLSYLEKLVEAVRPHVDTAKSERSCVAFERWESRDKAAPPNLWQLRTQLDEATLDEMTPAGRSRRSFWGDPRAEETALMAAARLSRPLSLESRKTLLAVVADLPAGQPTEPLDRLCTALGPVLSATADLKPYEQGHALALWLRETIAGDDHDAPIDPRSLLKEWGIPVRKLPAVESDLDAIACWGDRGPAVFYNPEGKHARSEAGLRATLAHEVAHLIVDRGRHLPAGEVLGGATPKHLEQRARAFAAELLLPRGTASRAVALHESLDEARQYLQETYGVSKELLGWQLRNGAAWERLSGTERREVERWCRPWRDG